MYVYTLTVVVICSIFVTLLLPVIKLKLNLIHFIIVFSSIPFLHLEYTGSNSLRIFGVPLYLLAFIPLLILLLYKYLLRIRLRLFFWFIMLLIFLTQFYNLMVSNAIINDWVHLFSLLFSMLLIPIFQIEWLSYSSNDRYNFLKYSFYVFIFLSVASILLGLFGYNSQRGNAMIIVNRNLFAVILFSYMYLSLLYLDYATKYKSYYILFVFFIFSFSILLMGARSSALGFVVFLFSYFLYKTPSRIILITPIFLSMVFIIYQFDFPIVSRFALIFDQYNEISNSLLSSGIDTNIKRVVLLNQALDIFKDNIFSGIGMGVSNYKNYLLLNDYGYLATPHSFYLYYLISLGLVSFFLFFYYIFKVTPFKIQRALNRNSFSFMMGILTIWVFTQYFMHPLLVFVLSLIGLSGYKYLPINRHEKL